MKTPTTDLNWAIQFADMLISLTQRGRDYRAAHANRSTSPRLHRRNHNEFSPGTSIRGRLVRGRFK